MTLRLEMHTILDPDGHGPALALPGDWIVVAVSDGEHVGTGEASHSGDDAACRRKLGELFDRYVRELEPTLEAVRTLEVGAFSVAGDFISATAISALDQALWELAARRAGVPVWRLVAEQPARWSVPVYVTLNRALSERSDAAYARAVDAVVALGLAHVKVAPFEAVQADGDQMAQVRRGLEVLQMLRERYPELGLRVDLHERLRPETAIELLPRLEALGLEWIEAPCPFGPVYDELRKRSRTPIAGGELFFGSIRFLELARRGWVDVVMPDVKHCGGFGPLLAVAEAVRDFGVEVAPHNPSGAVSTLASLHAAALLPERGEVELPLASDGTVPVPPELLANGELLLPEGPGWGLEPDLLTGNREVSS